MSHFLHRFESVTLIYEIAKLSPVTLRSVLSVLFSEGLRIQFTSMSQNQSIAWYASKALLGKEKYDRLMQWMEDTDKCTLNMHKG